MANKFIVYTSNPGFVPKTLNQVIEFAKATPKFYIASVEMNAHLANVKVGDQIVTKKGNNLFILRTFDSPLEELNAEDAAYLDEITRKYDVKKVQITSVANTIKYETWCPTVKPLILNSKTGHMKTNNSIASFADRLKATLLPSPAKGVRIATDGNICVATDNGYVTIDAENNLVSYPEELTLDLPVYVMTKPAEQLQVGDVIARADSYAKVTKIDGNKITAIGYTGAGATIHTIKDFLFNATMIRVVVSLAAGLNGQINPMLLLAMSDKKDNSMLPLLMMSQQNGAVGANPMLLALLAGGDKGDDSFKDILMFSAMSGNANPFGNLFGAAAPAAAVPVVAE